MKLKYYFSLIFFLFSSHLAISQCTPGDSISCPDPENNGQICPDTIAPVYRGVDYKQEITFLAPAKIDTLSLNIDVHHVTLVSVEGLPEGIEWLTNADEDEFFPEIYYCILFSGKTTVDTGSYPLKIVIDAYASFFGNPVFVAQIEDSTSISIEVLDEPSAVSELTDRVVAKIWPNPFDSEFSVELDWESGTIDIQLINILGETVFTDRQKVNDGLSAIKIDASFLPDGIYFVSLRNGERRRSYMVSKRQ